MTTLELIERGIGHNCLSDAYDMGRADREKELLMPYDAETIEELVSNSYNKGRADAIEEYKNRLWEDIETRYKNDIKILGYLSAQNLLSDVHNAICYFAEQLKEQRMNNFKCPMCTDCPDNCPLDSDTDAREHSADYYKGAREFAEKLRVNFDLLAWNNSDEVIDYTLAEWQKGANK